MMHRPKRQQNVTLHGVHGPANQTNRSNSVKREIVDRCCLLVDLTIVGLPVRWHANPLNGLSRVHDCDIRQTDNRSRYEKLYSYKRNRFHLGLIIKYNSVADGSNSQLTKSEIFKLQNMYHLICWQVTYQCF